MTTNVPPGYPPTDAYTIEAIFYRLAPPRHLLGEVTDSDAWLRPFETRGNPLYKQPDDPEAHGLSLRDSLDALEAARDLNPRIAKKSVAEVTIRPSDGWVKYTPEEGVGHHDWWTSPPGLVPVAVIVVEGRAA